MGVPGGIPGKDCTPIESREIGRFMGELVVFDPGISENEKHTFEDPSTHSRERNPSEARVHLIRNENLDRQSPCGKRSHPGHSTRMIGSPNSPDQGKREERRQMDFWKVTVHYSSGSEDHFLTDDLTFYNPAGKPLPPEDTPINLARRHEYTGQIDWHYYGDLNAPLFGLGSDLIKQLAAVTKSTLTDHTPKTHEKRPAEPYSVSKSQYRRDKRELRRQVKRARRK